MTSTSSAIHTPRSTRRAKGVQIGTAYLLCPEATPSPVHRAAIQGPDADRAALTNLVSGRPAPGIVTRIMRELGPMSDLAPEFPLATAAIAPLRAAAEEQGRGDFLTPLVRPEPDGLQADSAAELTRQLAAGLDRTLVSE